MTNEPATLAELFPAKPCLSTHAITRNVADRHALVEQTATAKKKAAEARWRANTVAKYTPHLAPAARASRRR